MKGGNLRGEVTKKRSNKLHEMIPKQYTIYD